MSILSVPHEAALKYVHPYQAPPSLPEDLRGGSRPGQHLLKIGTVGGEFVGGSIVLAGGAIRSGINMASKYDTFSGKAPREYDIDVRFL